MGKKKGQRRTLVIGDGPAEKWVRHNYSARLLELAAEGVLEEGKGYITEIRHDDWCAIWGGGICNCDPDIEVEEFESKEVE